jgi:hypothetical protein
MVASRKSRWRESRVGVLKDRARAKQQWLERVLSSPAANPAEVGRRQHWIGDALDRIKHAKANAMYRANLLDVYAEHLSVLELTLMRAAEEKAGATPAAPP